MTYTKPNVLATMNANSAIQTGANGSIKQSVNADSHNSKELNSTSSAYGADE